MTMKKPAHGIPQLSGGEASCEQIAGQYETFPFPPVYKIEQEDPRRDLRESFNLDLGLGPRAALKPGSRIWVPGCGTRWAVMIALQFRACNIVASDISAAVGLAAINSVGNLGGFFGPLIVGMLVNFTGTSRAGLLFLCASFIIGAVMLAAFKPPVKK